MLHYSTICPYLALFGLIWLYLALLGPIWDAQAGISTAIEASGRFSRELFHTDSLEVQTERLQTGSRQYCIVLYSTI